MKFDDILVKQVGEFGPYQRRIYFLVCLPTIAEAIILLLPVFMLATPKHRCALPGLTNDTYSVQSDEHAGQINASIPWVKDGLENRWELSSCYLYQDQNDTGLHSQGINASRIQCTDWVYDQSEYVSAVIDFNMVCQHSDLRYHYIMVKFFGALLGATAFGSLTDLFGRKTVFVFCILSSQVASAAQLVAPVYWVFIACQFLRGVLSSGIFTVSFIYIAEFVGPKYRMFAGTFIELFWSTGMFLLVGAAYWIRNWKTLMVTVLTPNLLFVLYIWIIPESPRWLMSMGKQKEAEEILKKMARSNKRQITKSFLDVTLEDVAAENQPNQRSRESAKVWRLFTNRSLFARTIFSAYNRFVLDFVYFGISLNIQHLGGNLYLNYTLGCAMETVAYLCVLVLVFRWGRKTLYFNSMAFAAVAFAVSSVALLLGSADNSMVSVGAVLLGRFGISAAFAISFVHTSELFPTSVRASAMALMKIIGMMGGIVSPYIFEMSNAVFSGRLSSAFPMLVYGIAIVLSMVLTLLIPETKDKNMPDRIKDAVKFENRDSNTSEVL